MKFRVCRYKGAGGERRGPSLGEGRKKSGSMARGTNRLLVFIFLAAPHTSSAAFDDARPQKRAAPATASERASGHPRASFASCPSHSPPHQPARPSSKPHTSGRTHKKRSDDRFESLNNGIFKFETIAHAFLPTMHTPINLGTTFRSVYSSGSIARQQPLFPWTGVAD